MPFSNPFPSPRPKMTHQVMMEQQRELARLRAESHRNSIFDARDQITSFIHAKYAEHLWPMVRIQCSLTLPQLRDIGRLSRDDGLRACLPLIRIPAIHEEVAEALWEFLAAERAESNTDDDAMQEEWERRFCGNATQDSEDTTQKQMTKVRPRRWNQARTRSRACSSESTTKQDVVTIEGTRCVFCCSGKLECDCPVPQEIMNEYGTLVGKKGEENGETTPERTVSKRGSTATIWSTTTLVKTISPISVRSTSSTRSSFYSFSPRLRRKLCLTPVLERLKSFTKSCNLPPEEEGQDDAQTFVLPTGHREGVSRWYSTTLGEFWGVGRGARIAVTDELLKERHTIGSDG
ncbi:hypothetical protein DL546_009692 [Coniochaeta pulveracea]|uniref:Uncharacterized protein n=1 Tax=Coniochaeta pulveracea TaxID=177199 RepID=A0A420YN86_9PEZI|nr:hypothetical protein DL546_009692 [Coniochaeta pulveracea]